jgi:hypothetical protein
MALPLRLLLRMALPRRLLLRMALLLLLLQALLRWPARAWGPLVWASAAGGRPRPLLLAPSSAAALCTLSSTTGVMKQIGSSSQLSS